MNNTTFTDILNDLTPDQREVVMNSTPKDWLDAITELVRDPGFWQGLGAAFLAGVAEGIQQFADDQCSS